MDKLLVDADGNVIVTDDGATILAEMDVEHPGARTVVDAAAAQAEAVGDGTTTTAVLAGELLAEAGGLLADGIHPTVVVEGYAEAARLATAALDERRLDRPADDETPELVAASSLAGLGVAGPGADALAALAVRAVRAASGDGGFDRERVRYHARAGPGAAASTLVSGVVLDDEPAREDGPRRVVDAAVAVLDLDLDVRTTAADARYDLTSADQLTAALDAEDRERRGYADALAAAGVAVVVCTGSIDDRVAGRLAERGILALADVSDDDARAVARATGAARLGTLADLDPADLGRAETVRVERDAGGAWTVLEGGADAQTVTLSLRAGTDHALAELERAVEGAVDAVAAARAGGVVAGAGAVELALAARLREAAAGTADRRGLAIEAFADALESIPRALAVTAGLDPIDALVDLQGGRGRTGVVVDADGARIADPVAAGVLDPVPVVRGAIEAATEAVTALVRIDDVIATR
jgi:chaperonin GroEL (HSP60 family)